MGVDALRYTSAPQRRSAMLAALQSTGFVAITDMARTFGVSDMTVRRDVKRLEADGEVRVVRGGVSLRHGTLRTPDFLDRAETQSEAKQQLAQVASAMVRQDDVIGVDSGTTTYQLAATLPEPFAGTVVTNSIPVIQLMLSRPRIRVVSLGGDLVAEHQAFVGPLAVDAASHLRVRLFFLGAAAVDARGVYVHNTIESSAKLAMMQMADRVVLLADAGKFARSAPILLCPLTGIHAIVTDEAPDPTLAASLAAAGVSVHEPPG